jgi:hypothetical protein
MEYITQVLYLTESIEAPDEIGKRREAQFYIFCAKGTASVARIER